MHPYAILTVNKIQKGGIRMDLLDTLEQYVLQLKNTARTLEAVARVCQKINGNAL